MYPSGQQPPRRYPHGKSDLEAIDSSRERPVAVIGSARAFREWQQRNPCGAAVHVQFAADVAGRHFAAVVLAGFPPDGPRGAALWNAFATALASAADDAEARALPVAVVGRMTAFERWRRSHPYTVAVYVGRPHHALGHVFREVVQLVGGSWDDELQEAYEVALSRVRQ